MFHHRHQVSLEGILDFSPTHILSASQRSLARQRFYQIIGYFDTAGEVPQADDTYNRPRLIRLTYEYALSDESRDLFLQAFFRSIQMPLDDLEEVDDRMEQLRSDVFGFAEYLMDNFFLPLRAATFQTPKPSPAYHSAVLMVQGRDQEFTTTPARIAALRGTSLVRDHHRCVISRAFDAEEAKKRLNRDGGLNAKDDDGNELSSPYMVLEVAHIIPHSLVRLQANAEARQAALAILNLFDIGVAHLIEGVEIDRPFNTLSLTHDYHKWFGEFEIFFTPVTDSQPHTYRIETFQHALLGGLPVTRTLLLSPDRNIDPPSSRLLAIHRAIAHILHLSAAGEYINKFLSDMDEGYVRSDGLTELGRFVKLRLRNLDNTRVNVR